jgi:hypothetical protein
MSIVWGLLFAVAYFAVRRYATGAVVVGLLVVSHWVLDAIVHIPDLPLTPWDMTRIGLGVWRSIPLTVLVEGLLFGVGVWSYLTFTRAQDRTAVWSVSLIIVLLLVIFIGATFGPPPPDVAAVAWTDVMQVLLVLLAWWADQHRTPQQAAFA